MAELKGKSNPKQKRFKPKKVAPTLTPEQQAEILAALEKAKADAKAEAERIHLYGKTVEKMTHRQLRAEIRNQIRKEHVKIGKGLYEPQAGLTIAFATIFDAVLDSTKTLYDKRNKPYPNPSPFAALSCYVR